MINLGTPIKLHKGEYELLTIEYDIRKYYTMTLLSEVDEQILDQQPYAITPLMQSLQEQYK
jgi:hypothetical protein